MSKSQTCFRAWDFVTKKFNTHTQNNYTILQVRKKWGDLNYQKRQKKVSRVESAKSLASASSLPGTVPSSSGTTATNRVAASMGQFYAHNMKTGGGDYVHPPEEDPEKENDPSCTMPIDLPILGQNHHKVQLPPKGPNPVFSVNVSDLSQVSIFVHVILLDMVYIG